MGLTLLQIQSSKAKPASHSLLLFLGITLMDLPPANSSLSFSAEIEKCCVHIVTLEYYCRNGARQKKKNTNNGKWRRRS
jgi:hypothetical protein